MSAAVWVWPIERSRRRWRQPHPRARIGALQIILELETPGDSRTMFRLLVDVKIIAEGLTAVQAHLLVGAILERIALPNKPASQFSSSTPATTNEALDNSLRRDVVATK
jgi:hypothetical protein